MNTARDSQLELMELAERMPAAAATQTRPARRAAEGSSGETSGRRDTGDAGAAAASQPGALLTFAQAARMLGISVRQFRRLVDAGKVAFVRVSERSPRVRPSELERYLEGSTVRYSEPS